MTTATKTTPTEHAKNFLASCAKYGFRFEVTQSVVTIGKKITPGSNEEFRNAECDASCIFDHVPLRGGSTWGTDGGSIGGAVAIKNGYFKLNKSGNGKAFSNAVKKLTK